MVELIPFNVGAFVDFVRLASSSVARLKVQPLEVEAPLLVGAFAARRLVEWEACPRAQERVWPVSEYAYAGGTKPSLSTTYGRVLLDDFDIAPGKSGTIKTKSLLDLFVHAVFVTPLGFGQGNEPLSIDQLVVVSDWQYTKNATGVALNTLIELFDAVVVEASIPKG